jgi:hypothetical protein
MRFVDHLRRNPMCFDSGTDRSDFDASPLIGGTTVFLVSEIASQLIESVKKNPDGSMLTILTPEGEKLLKFLPTGDGYKTLAVDQFAGIVPPFDNCFFEWPTPFEPDVVDCGVHLQSMSKEWIAANFPDDGYSFVLQATVFYRFVIQGVSIVGRETQGMIASDSEGQLLDVKVSALLPEHVDRSLPSSRPQSTPIMVVLVSMMMLHHKLVKSTLSAEIVKSRQQRRLEERNPHRATPPLVRYHILSINPETTHGDSHNKGRWEVAWHMVRGHLRHLKSGKVVPVRAHSKGNPLKGVIVKDYALEAPSSEVA